MLNNCPIKLLFINKTKHIYDNKQALSIKFLIYFDCFVISELTAMFSYESLEFLFCENFMNKIFTRDRSIKRLNNMICLITYLISRMNDHP